MFDLERFVGSCLDASRSDDPPATARRILSEVIADRASIAAALGQARTPSDMASQYRFLYQSPELTILHVIVPPNFRSPPHNHLVWVAIGMYEGCEKHTFYRKQEGQLVEEGVRDVMAPDVITLASDSIHGIENPLGRPSHALHVYGGSLANSARSIWNPYTLQEEPFQLAALAQYEAEMNDRLTGDAT